MQNILSRQTGTSSQPLSFSSPRSDSFCSSESETRHFEGSTSPEWSVSDIPSLHSIALSEAETIVPDIQQANSLRLGHTFQDNFRSFAPYLVSRRNVETYSVDSDDDRTMVSGPEAHPIMERQSTSYNQLKILVIALQKGSSELLVFSDVKNFELFAKEKSSRKKERKQAKHMRESYPIGLMPNAIGPENSMYSTVSDANSPSMLNTHALPLLSVVAPYMSALRPKTPYMTFRKYGQSQHTSSPRSLASLCLESIDFCTVKIKVFQQFKRYLFLFHPDNGHSFKIWAFQHNFRPFTDFNYKSTRFRVFGTSRMVSYPTYFNPELKLQVLDRDQASLMDNLIEKKKEKLFGLGKRSSEVVTGHDLEDPIPCPNNPMNRQVLEREYSSFLSSSVPQEMPPFGKFLASRAGLKDMPLVSKKFAEVGKIGVYQDPSEQEELSNANTDTSVDLDSLVLTVVFLALRETSLRSTIKRDDVEAYHTYM